MFGVFLCRFVTRFWGDFFGVIFGGKWTAFVSFSHYTERPGFSLLSWLVVDPVSKLSLPFLSFFLPFFPFLFLFFFPTDRPPFPSSGCHASGQSDTYRPIGGNGGK